MGWGGRVGRERNGECAVREIYVRRRLKQQWESRGLIGRRGRVVSVEGGCVR